MDECKPLFHGLYSFVEQMDDTFLRRHGMDGKGDTYKVGRCSLTLPNPR